MTIGTIQRAYQLAPTCCSEDELSRKLKCEGYSQVDEHLAGGEIRKRLNAILKSK